MAHRCQRSSRDVQPRVLAAEHGPFLAGPPLMTPPQPEGDDQKAKKGATLTPAQVKELQDVDPDPA